MKTTSAGGFTLVEVSIVLIVIGVLTSSLVSPLGAYLRKRHVDETHAQLTQVRHALIGHLMTRGHLPCPLADTRARPGRDARAINQAIAEGTPCVHGDGLLPGSVLGVLGTLLPNGALLDTWGRPLRYGVSLVSSRDRGDTRMPDWTTRGELIAVGLTELAADLVVCQSPAAGRCPANQLQTDSIAFVVYSTGSDASDRDGQKENLDGDSAYVIAPHSRVEGFHFDDQFAWASRNELAYWLVRAHVLP